jgi:hypothetical protein
VTHIKRRSKGRQNIKAVVINARSRKVEKNLVSLIVIACRSRCGANFFLDASYHGDTVTLSAIVQEAPVGQPGMHLAVPVVLAKVAIAAHSSGNHHMRHRGHWDQSG